MQCFHSSQQPLSNSFLWIRLSSRFLVSSNIHEISYDCSQVCFESFNCTPPLLVLLHSSHNHKIRISLNAPIMRTFFFRHFHIMLIHTMEHLHSIQSLLSSRVFQWTLEHKSPKCVVCSMPVMNSNYFSL